MGEEFQSQYLTPARLCWVLDIGETTESDLRKHRQIDFFRSGRVIRYAPEWVLAFILRNRVKSRLPVHGTNGANTGLPDEAWARIERLIADQVEQRMKYEIQREQRAA